MHQNSASFMSSDRETRARRREHERLTKNKKTPRHNPTPYQRKSKAVRGEINRALLDTLP